MILRLCDVCGCLCFCRSVPLCCLRGHCQLSIVAFFAACFVAYFAASLAACVVAGFVACIVASVVAKFVCAFVASAVVPECLHCRVTLFCLLPVHLPLLLQMLLHKGICCSLCIVDGLCEQSSMLHYIMKF